MTGELKQTGFFICNWKIFALKSQHISPGMNLATLLISKNTTAKFRYIIIGDSEVKS